MPQITGTWDEQILVWGEANAALIQKYPVFAVGAAFYRGESGPALANAAQVSVLLERTGLTITGRNSRGEYKSDPSVEKTVLGVWPIIEGTPGDTVYVAVGSHDSPRGNVLWSGARAFVIGQDYFLDFQDVSGKYLAIRFTSVGQRKWRLLGYDIDVEPIGEH